MNTATDIKLNKVSPLEAAELMEDVILDAFIRGRRPLNIMLHGSPGTAKSAVTHQVGDSIERQLQAHFNDPEIQLVVFDVRLSCYEAAEVQGIPHNVDSGEYITKIVDGVEVQIAQKMLVHSTPEWFPKKKSKVYYILFFDEITNAPISVIHAAYRVLLDRTIQNGSKLPDNCAIIGAGNLPEDKTGAKKLAPAAANRFGMHLYFDKTRLVESALSYAVRTGWDPILIAFIAWRREAIVYDFDGTSNEFATLRSLEFVNEHLQNTRLNQNDEKLSMAIAGAIGSSHAVDLMGYREHEAHLPDWEKVKRGEETVSLPKNDEGFKFYVSTSLAFQLLDSLKLANEDRETATTYIDNLSVVLDEMPSEIVTVMIRTMAQDKATALQLFHFPSLHNQYKKVANRVKMLSAA